MTALFEWVAMGLALVVVLACICRINLLHPARHDYTWTIKYSLFTAFAGGEFLQALQTPDSLNGSDLAGLAGIGLHLLVTHKGWRNGPPPVAEKSKEAA